MSREDLERLLTVIDESSPSGPDLEHDPEFISIEQRLEGTPEREIGDILEPYRPPAWSEIGHAIESLLTRTHDLRLALFLTRCKMHSEGLKGLAVGLSLVRYFLDRFWPTVHPQLDPDDDLDPTYRLNTLKGLSDHPSFIAPLSQIPILTSRSLGHFSLVQMHRAKRNEPPAEGESLWDESHFRAICLDNPPEEIISVYQSVLDSLEELEEINRIIESKLGDQNTLDLDAIKASLNEISQFLSPFAGPQSSGEPDETQQELDLDFPASSLQAPQSVRSGGAINNRNEVIRTLDLIIDYYHKNEPSSPVPILLKRASTLVNKDFLEIIRDMAPDGVHQIEILAGIDGQRD